MTDRPQRTMKMRLISDNVMLDAACRRSCKHVEPLEPVLEFDPDAVWNNEVQPQQ
jgi:hypothetical protein